MKTEPTPDEFQFPETVHAPVVIVSVPDVPPVIVKPLMMTVEAFAVRMPPLPTTTSAASAAAPSARSADASAVVDVPSETVSVVSQRNPRVAIVKVCAVPAELVNVTELNSASAKFVPANVIEPPVAESNVTVPEPASHVASVDAFVHVPETVHVSEPKSIADKADEMLTAPVIATAPDVLVRSPPLIVSEPADVMANVLFANVPPEMMRPFVTTTAVASVTVPAEMVRSSNVLSVESNVIVAVASNVTIPVPCV